MCSDFPSSESADIYKRLVAASVSRTKSRTFEPVIIRNNLPAKNKRIFRSNRNLVKQDNFPRSRVNEKSQSQQDQCKRIKEVTIDSNNARIGLQIKINSCTHNIHHRYLPNENTPEKEEQRFSPVSNRTEKEEQRFSPVSNRTVGEVYDDDVMSVWSSFDLKTYSLNGKLRESGLRAKSAPSQRQQYHCRSAAIYFSENAQCQSSRTSVTPRKNKKLQHVLSETSHKLLKKDPVDYEIYLKALKLEKCVPSGVSDNQIRKNINLVISRHDSAKRK